MNKQIRLPVPKPPVFATAEEARRDRKTKLIAAFRIFSRLGYDEGVMGHISVRDPETPDHFWMNPFAVSFGALKVSDLLLLNHDGDILDPGNGGFIHIGGFPLHSAVLQGNPQVVSLVHTHSLYGRAWSALGRPVDPISSESATFYNRQAIYDSYDNGEGHRLSDALGSKRALILKHHGLLTAGQSVDEAVYSFIALEKSCQAQLAVEAIATPDLLKPEHAEAISARYSPDFGWLNFQPLFQDVIRQQPDILA